MQPTRNQTLTVLLALVLGGVAPPAFADDACVDFKWDVRKERSLFAETPAVLAAGRSEASAPAVVPNRLYSLRLVAQDHAAFFGTSGGENAHHTRLCRPCDVEYCGTGQLPHCGRSADLDRRGVTRSLATGFGLSRSTQLQRAAQNRAVRSGGGAALRPAVQWCSDGHRLVDHHCRARAEALTRSDRRGAKAPLSRRRDAAVQERSLIGAHQLSGLGFLETRGAFGMLCGGITGGRRGGCCR
jgi:hypothetical protein